MCDVLIDDTKPNWTKNGPEYWNSIISRCTKLVLTLLCGRSTASFMHVNVFKVPHFCHNELKMKWIIFRVWLLSSKPNFREKKPTSYKWWDELAQTRTVHINWSVIVHEHRLKWFMMGICQWTEVPLNLDSLASAMAVATAVVLHVAPVHCQSIYESHFGPLNSRAVWFKMKIKWNLWHHI